MLRSLTVFLLAVASAAAAAARTSYPHSILAVPAQADATHPRRGHLARAVLTADERARDGHVEVVLRMRHFDEFLARIQRGEQIPAAEVAAKYHPLAADEARVVAWLKQAGLRVERTDSDHLAVFARGSVHAIETAFQTSFARVQSADGGEYSSAITAPSIPDDLADVVLGIHGLQPHLKRHPLASTGPRPFASGTTLPPFYPAQIAAAYNANNPSLTGAGQTIAIISSAYPAPSDLTTFWTDTATGGSLANVKDVNVESGPLASPTQGYIDEVTLDVEWASAMAPGAAIRVYGAPENDEADWDLTFQQIYSDLASVPSMHVLSISIGAGELDVDQDFLIIESQYLANLANAGVTIFSASGDNGSSADGNGVASVSYPTSDPSVTGVGGTSLTLDSSGNVATETAWSGSGGGVSTLFARPTWQTGVGVPAGNFRLVPDVASVGNPNTGALVVDGGIQQQIGGTSWGAPTWAGMAAQINQSRAKAGKGPLGALNPRIYPLIGSSSFRDITSGKNGKYTAGVGYDEVTGIGVPNLAGLLQASLEVSPPLAVVAQLPSTQSVAGQPVTFAVIAAGVGPFTYQWQRLPAGATTWSVLADNGTDSGTGAATLVIGASTYAMNQDQYECVVSNATGSVTSAPEKLLVNSVGLTTLAGWPGSAGRADGAGWSARFDFIGGITLDSSGNILVADGQGNTVRKVTPAGVVTTIAGDPGVTGFVDGTGAAAQFGDPAGIAVDASGNMYIADALNCAVRKVTPAGVVSTLAGNGHSASVDGTGSGAQFVIPSSIAIGPDGNLYVVEGPGATIRMVTPGGTVTTLAGKANTHGTADGAGAAARFADLEGITLDSAGNIYVSDTGNNSIRMVTPAGVVSTLALKYSPATSRAINSPTGLRIDAFGNIYVVDSGNALLREISPANVVTTIAGSYPLAENVDGPLGVNVLGLAGSDVALGSNGIIYVADATNYTLRRLVVGALVAPVVQTPPASTVVTTGQAASFTVAASASTSLPVTYQWQVAAPGGSAYSNLSEGSGASGTTTATLTVASVTTALSGNLYRCVLTNNAGSTSSAAGTLTVQGPPAFTGTAASVGLKVGGSTTLSASFNGGNLTYQWLLNGTAIAGATGVTYTISNFAAASAGTYAVTATNSFGSASATVASVAVSTTRLVNLSSLGLSTPAAPLTAGFIISGTGGKSVLIRGIGPALAAAPFSLPGTLADPQLTLQNTGTKAVIATDTGWTAAAAGVSALDTAFAQTGAFPLATASADSALLTSVPVSSSTGYSAVVGSAGGRSGVALAEIYDADTGTPATRLANVSTLAGIAASNSLTAGFTVVGQGSESVLIRAVGPTLGTFGLSGTLSAPVLSVVNTASQVTVATNSGWTSDPTQVAALTAAMTSVSAFSLPSGSKDAAVLVSLPAGTYSAQVTGVGGATGTVLLEIYEVSP